VVVGSVDLLHSRLKARQVFGWIFTQTLSECVIEVLEMIEGNTEHVDMLLCVLLQLFSKIGIKASLGYL
jgi:hypothetical protein